MIVFCRLEIRKETFHSGGISATPADQHKQRATYWVLAGFVAIRA